MTRAVFQVLLHQDASWDVMSLSESLQNESTKAYLSSVWLGQAYGGRCLVRDEVAGSALMTFGLNQRFSTFCICVHWHKKPTTPCGCTGNSVGSIAYYSHFFWAMIHRGHAWRRLSLPSGLLLPSLLKYASWWHL